MTIQSAGRKEMASYSLHHGQSKPFVHGLSGTWTERSANYDFASSHFLSLSQNINHETLLHTHEHIHAVHDNIKTSIQQVFPTNTRSLGATVKRNPYGIGGAAPFDSGCDKRTLVPPLWAIHQWLMYMCDPTCPCAQRCT